MTQSTGWLKNGRRAVVLGAFTAIALALATYAFNLYQHQADFLQDKGDAIHLRKLTTEAHRGLITERNGDPLAVSTPVRSVWVKPVELMEARGRWSELATLLDYSPDALEAILLPRKTQKFLWVRRQLSPEVAHKLQEAAIPGVYLTDEYRRYYPGGEVTANLLGFTNVDDRGQEGIELAFDDSLRGQPGQERVVQDRLGRVVEHVERIAPAQSGADLALSIDRRLQYIAYRELKKAVQQHSAVGGQMVILDVQTGEVLAMVNQPSYNPNNRSGLKSEAFRNRAVTDLFEPGSTLKPFTIAAGLEAGRFTPESMIDTNPGSIRIGNHEIRDVHPIGVVPLPVVIQKSSNVGAIKVAFAIEPKQFWDLLNRVGFGHPSSIEVPGESAGQLDGYRNWGMQDRAVLAIGYHLTTSAVQLARAYGVLASGGLLRPITVQRLTSKPPETRVMSQEVAAQVRAMMELVTEKGGTAVAAAVEGYSVAGKTGTVKNNSGGEYEEKSYKSLFAGFLPASAPRLVGVVMIDRPRGEQFYGGLVAAPVFSAVMHEAVRIFNVPPDKPLPVGKAPALLPGWTTAPPQMADKTQ